MRPTDTCTTCSKPITRGLLVMEEITIDPRPHPDGNLIVTGRIDGMPNLQRPQRIPGSEPFRYREHTCTSQEPTA